MFDDCESDITNPSAAIVGLNYVIATCIVLLTLTASIYFGYKLKHDENGKKMSSIYSNLSVVTFLIESIVVILIFSIVVYIQNCPEWYTHSDHSEENSHDDSHYDCNLTNTTYIDYNSTLNPCYIYNATHDESHEDKDDHDDEDNSHTEEDEHENEEDEHDHIEHSSENVMFESIAFSGLGLYTVGFVLLSLVITDQTIQVFKGTHYKLSKRSIYLLKTLILLQVVLVFAFVFSMIVFHDEAAHTTLPIIYIWIFIGLFITNAVAGGSIFSTKLKKFSKMYAEKAVLSHHEQKRVSSIPKKTKQMVRVTTPSSNGSSEPIPMPNKLPRLSPATVQTMSHDGSVNSTNNIDLTANLSGSERSDNDDNYNSGADHDHDETIATVATGEPTNTFVSSDISSGTSGATSGASSNKDESSKTLTSNKWIFSGIDLKRQSKSFTVGSLNSANIKRNSKKEIYDTPQTKQFLSVISKYSVLMGISLTSTIIASINWLIVWYLIDNSSIEEHGDEHDDHDDENLNGNLIFYFSIYCLLYTMIDSLIKVICLALQFSVNKPLYGKVCAKCDKCFQTLC